MKRFIVLLVLAILGFYGAWPAWSGYRIAQAFRNEDPELLASKVDFASVRASLKPVVATEVASRVERAKREAGALGSLIAGQLKEDLVARIVDGTLTSVVTPDSIIRIARQGGNLRDAVEKVVVDQVGRGGGGPGGERGSGRLPGGLNLPGNLPGGLPGIGRHFVLSITNRDYTAIMGITIFYAAVLMVMIFIVDMLYLVLDPRIKYREAR